MNQTRYKGSLLLYLSMILLSASNDIELNPGPGGLTSNTTTYPCGTCDKPVTWDDNGIVIVRPVTNGIMPIVSLQIQNTTQNMSTTLLLPGDCIMYGCPNYSTFCFSLVFSTSNHFSVLSDTPLQSPVPSRNLKPVHSSTPDTSKKRNSKEQNTLRMLNVNFQPIKTNCTTC